MPTMYGPLDYGPEASGLMTTGRCRSVQTITMNYMPQGVKNSGGPCKV